MSFKYEAYVCNIEKLLFLSTRCSWYCSNDLLERRLKLTQRNRSERESREKSENREKRSSKERSRNHQASSDESRHRTGDRDPKSKENAKGERSKSRSEEERSENYGLFKCMFDFESALETLIKYSEDEKNRSFLKVKINDYEDHFERFLSQLKTSDNLDKATGTFHLFTC